MKKSYIVDSTCKDMRLDRWIRLTLGKIPQGLIEKFLRSGKIKLNNKTEENEVEKLIKWFASNKVVLENK